MRILALCSLLFCAPLQPAFAHEFWIEPVAWQMPAQATIVARLVNGQNFGGTEIAYFPGRFSMFTVAWQDQLADVAGRPGDRPALNAPTLGEGLHRLSYVATNNTISYDSWEKFARFAAHKDFDDIEARHQARDLPEADFSEVYSRYCRALFAVGDGYGDDAPSGMETEIVALDNPFEAVNRGAATIRVQIFYQGQPRPGAQLELFEKPLDGSAEATITLHRADENGIATLPVRPGYAYLADAVVLRIPAPALAEQSSAVWETLWASLTFALPAAQ